LDDVVDDLRERSEEVGGVDFRVEEDFGGEEALVPNIDRIRLGINALADPKRAFRADDRYTFLVTLYSPS
jgi:hypothetical protein